MPAAGTHAACRCGRGAQVRRHAAEQLYISFLGRVDEGEDEGSGRDYEQAADHLLAVAWDGPLDVVSEQKQELEALLQLA